MAARNAIDPVTRALLGKPARRFCIFGSGSAAFHEAQVCSAAVNLTGKAADKVAVLYLGTATYDIERYKTTQTVRFAELGCTVTELKVAVATPPDMAELVGSADIIVVSGGNTLYSCDRWNKLGLTELIRAAMERGCVLSGGSAGCICWFDAGHSDSHDPESYKNAMLGEPEKDAEGAALKEGDAIKKWTYIRSPGLGFLPGLVCPHHDRVQSNGVLRAHDFDGMMQRHAGERGICLDHWAGLLITGDEYTVLAVDGKPGSVTADGGYTEDSKGTPGVWTKVVEGGKVVRSLAPTSGKISDLFSEPTSIVPDPKVDECRAANPDDTDN